MHNLIKILLLQSFWISFACLLPAQHVLDANCNMFRGGDRLIKQEIKYKSPGRSGENVLWDFSGQKSINKDYELIYEGDTILSGREHGTLYEYRLMNDSLFQIGYKNNTTSFSFDKPELLLVYPFAYGSKTEDYFWGTGNYCQRLKMRIQGKTSVVADASGVLILPTKDTLYNVLRVHSTRKIARETLPARMIPTLTGMFFSTDSVDYHLSADSVWYQEELYRWYVKGYRYPVFEMIENIIYRHQVPQRHFNTAFYYTPVDQYYDLVNDPDNVNVRVRAESEDRISSERKNSNSGKPSNLSDKKINYNAYVEGESLTVDYLSNESGTIGYFLYDVQGRLLKEYPDKQLEKGYHSETIPLNNITQRELVLRLNVNGEVLGMKLINK